MKNKEKIHLTELNVKSFTTVNNKEGLKGGALSNQIECTTSQPVYCGTNKTLCC